MKKITIALKVLAVASALVALSACGSLNDDDNSSTLLIIESITGTTTAGDPVAFLQSDVERIGGQGAYVTADAATANLRPTLLNPDPVNPPSVYNNVVLTNYRVTYELPTGPGTPGVDVPLPFDGNFSTVTLEVDQSTAVPFVVVLEAAKLAAPLAALVGTTTVIETRAKIEIFGLDLKGKEVKATGYLTIYFADYIDEPLVP
jgi:hypothetical protein